MEGDLEVDLEGEMEGDSKGDFRGELRGDFRGDFKQDMEGDLLFGVGPGVFGVLGHGLTIYLFSGHTHIVLMLSLPPMTRQQV